MKNRAPNISKRRVGNGEACMPTAWLQLCSFAVVGSLLPLLLGKTTPFRRFHNCKQHSSTKVSKCRAGMFGGLVKWWSSPTSKSLGTRNPSLLQKLAAAGHQKSRCKDVSGWCWHSSQVASSRTFHFCRFTRLWILSLISSHPKNCTHGGMLLDQMNFTLASGWLWFDFSNLYNMEVCRRPSIPKRGDCLLSSVSLNLSRAMICRASVSSIRARGVDLLIRRVRVRCTLVLDLLIRRVRVP